MLSISFPTPRRLPVEVCERVIDWLVVDYAPEFGLTHQGHINLQRDLLSCALVCRGFKARAEKYLFSFLAISPNGVSQYESILRKTPKLCGLARTLYFRNQYQEAFDNKGTEKTIETASHVARIAHKLPNVHYLHIQRINLAIEHPRFACGSVLSKI